VPDSRESRSPANDAQSVTTDFVVPEQADLLD
jgi:hypothetical protein